MLVPIEDDEFVGETSGHFVILNNAALHASVLATRKLAEDPERIAGFCRERGIRSLSLLGSVLRDDFDPERSDVDVLAEFAPGALHGIGLRYFAFAEELGVILGQRVISVLNFTRRQANASIGKR